MPAQQIPLLRPHTNTHMHPCREGYVTPHTHTQLLKSISEGEGNPLILLGKVEFSSGKGVLSMLIVLSHPLQYPSDAWAGATVISALTHKHMITDTILLP